ncbi:hypothetical protein CR513_21459, partial [Mucuna pruriens]
MRKRFMPASYERDIQHKLQSLYQGSRSTEKEREEATIAQFLHGLNKEIQDIVEIGVVPLGDPQLVLVARRAEIRRKLGVTRSVRRGVIPSKFVKR